ncbi:MAG: aspartate aminotransferase family protein, partial [Actinomycetes bacterium]
MTSTDAAITTLDGLIEREEAAFLARTTRSAELWQRASDVMPGGVASSWASSRPVPVWVDRGLGGHVWDADGTEYV